MLPVQFDPALILSGLPRPAGFQPDLLARLTPGEAVQATILGVLDDGMLQVLVKGLALQAASLVGPLPVGQVLEGHVETRDGQILLRLDQPGAPGMPAGLSAPVPAVALDPAERVRLAALLKTLLPADEPLAGSLARLAVSLTEAAEQGRLSPQLLGAYDALRQQVLLEGHQGGSAPGGARLQEILLTLGFHHERDLLVDLNNNSDITAGSAHNLRSWLMQLLAETASDAAASPPSGPASRSPGAGPAQTAGSAGIAAGAVPVTTDAGQVPSPRMAESRPVMGMADPEGAGESAAESTGRPVVGSVAPPSVPAHDGRSKPSAGVERPGHEDSLPNLQNKQNGMEAALEPPRKAALPEERTATSGPANGQPPSSGQIAAPLSREPGPQGKEPSLGPAPAVATAVKRGVFAAGPGVSEEVPDAVPAPRVETAWVKDAQHLLTVLERSHALSGLNAQSGQPICFDFPLAWGGQAQARVYVEPRDSGGEEAASQPRPYNVVTLLELDGLGAVRVDTVLTGKRLSARFLLDHPAVERAVAVLLPALTRSLSERGYQVEVLTSGTADPRHLRGDDLRVRAAPKVSLVNFRA